MWLNDRHLAKNEATFLRGPCPFQTIIENNVKIVVCCGHGLTLRGQGQTLSPYFNFHMINYTHKVGWEACFTSSAGCFTQMSEANLIKLCWVTRSEGGGNDMYMSYKTNANTRLLYSFIYCSAVAISSLPASLSTNWHDSFKSDHLEADCSPERDNRQTYSDCEIKMFTPINCQISSTAHAGFCCYGHCWHEEHERHESTLKTDTQFDLI